MYFVPWRDALAGSDVLIVGGGDSAFDWALSLEDRASSITLIHRRDRFRAHEHTIAQVMDSSVEVLTQAARKVLVDTTMATSLPRVFAAGDITSYEGKVDLIAVGFGEAAIAVNNVATVVDPEAAVPRPLVRSALTVVAQRLAMVADTPSPWSRRPWNH